VKTRFSETFANTGEVIDTSGMRDEFGNIVKRIKDAIPPVKQGRKIAIVKDEGEEPEKKAPKPTASVQSAALGGFAQSMNMLFGRSANAGLLEENKRQTDLLKKIEEKTVKQKPAKDPAPAEAVFA
jgi:hypothetical protein